MPIPNLLRYDTHILRLAQLCHLLLYLNSFIHQLYLATPFASQAFPELRNTAVMVALIECVACNISSTPVLSPELETFIYALNQTVYEYADESLHPGYTL